jgi:hypothetical protein
MGDHTNKRVGKGEDENRDGEIGEKEQMGRGDTVDERKRKQIEMKEEKGRKG